MHAFQSGSPIGKSDRVNSMMSRRNLYEDKIYVLNSCFEYKMTQTARRVPCTEYYKYMTTIIVRCLQEGIPWPISIATFPLGKATKIVAVSCLQKLPRNSRRFTPETLRRTPTKYNLRRSVFCIFDHFSTINIISFTSWNFKQQQELFKKNQNAPGPSEYPPVRGENMSKRLGGIKGCKYKTSSWHLNGFPDGNNIGSTV